MQQLSNNLHLESYNPYDSHNKLKSSFYGKKTVKIKYSMEAKHHIFKLFNWNALLVNWSLVRNQYIEVVMLHK